VRHLRVQRALLDQDFAQRLRQGRRFARVGEIVIGAHVAENARSFNHLALTKSPSLIASPAAINTFTVGVLNWRRPNAHMFPPVGSGTRFSGLIVSANRQTAADLS
jgi:hypothetical protein